MQTLFYRDSDEVSVGRKHPLLLYCCVSFSVVIVACSYLQTHFAHDPVASIGATLLLATLVEILFDIGLLIDGSRPRRIGLVGVLLLLSYTVDIALGPGSDGRYWHAQPLMIALLVSVLWGSDRFRRVMEAEPNSRRT